MRALETEREMINQLVLIALTAAMAGTHARLRQPNDYDYENHMSGSGDGPVDDEDYEGSGGDEVSGSTGFPNAFQGYSI